MDNLTHALVGAALAKSGLDRRVPLATTTLILAANAPDIDVFSYARGPWFALSFRRGITHGLPALLVLPFVVAGAMVAWDRWVRRRRDPDAAPAPFRELLLLSFIGLLTHPTLDWMNTYGMRWWLPFDGRWSYGDSLFIVDPWLWLLLGGAVALGARRTRRGAVVLTGLAAVTSWLVLTTEMVPPPAKVVWAAGVAAFVFARAVGRPIGLEKRVHLSCALTALAAVYIAAMVGIHHAGAAAVRADVGATGSEGARVMVGQLPARPVRSEVLIAGERYMHEALVWTPSAGFRHEVDGVPIPFVAADAGVSDAQAAAAVERAEAHPDIAHYMVWSRFPYWRVARTADGYAVTVGDARYIGRGGLGGLTVTLP
ncbi:MAG: metal-dependent hydrolase [Gemmatimonadetes bacterium]|nr:metal-dependent hydrolase [Gemmatimonadota bacterium]